eukprot:gene5553-5608_t
MLDSAHPSSAQRFFTIAEALCRAVGNAIRPGFIDAVLAMIVVRRIQRVRRVLLMLEVRFLAGRVRRRVVRARVEGEAEVVREQGSRGVTQRSPRGMGWLFNLVPHEAACQAGYMRGVLAEPGMQALLAACPQAVRVLGPVCVMLGIERAAYVPVGAEPVPRVRRVRPWAPKPDLWVFDQAREDAHYSSTQVPRRFRLRVRKW